VPRVRTAHVLRRVCGRYDPDADGALEPLDVRRLVGEVLGAEGLFGGRGGGGAVSNEQLVYLRVKMWSYPTSCLICVSSV
jgi:hypothetical protein